MADTPVLIIDDNESNILVLEHLLRRQNVSVQRLTSTHDLCNQLNTMQQVEAVFLDWKMPEINGTEALHIIKAHPNFQKTKVIAYSVHIRALETALQLGFDDFVDKPVNARAFVEQLQQILERKQV